MIFFPVCVLCLLSAEKPVRFSLSLAALFLAGSFYQGEFGRPIYRARSFFGIHRVTEKDGFRMLVHGNIVHGMQRITDDSARRTRTVDLLSRPKPHRPIADEQVPEEPRTPAARRHRGPGHREPGQLREEGAKVDVLRNRSGS